MDAVQLWGCVMQNIFTSIAKLLGRKSITNEEILEVLRNHEKRIGELEQEVADLHRSFDDQRQVFDGRLKDLAKKGQAAVSAGAKIPQ